MPTAVPNPGSGQGRWRATRGRGSLTGNRHRGRTPERTARPPPRGTRSDRPGPTSAAGLEQGEKIASDARDPHTCPQPGLSRHPRASPPGSDRSPSPGRDHGRQPSDTEGRPEDRPEPQDGRRDTPCPPPPRRPRSVRAGGGGATGGCWSTHPGGPHGLLRERGGGDSGDSGDGDTPSQLRRSNLRRAHRAPRPRRQPDARAGAALLLELGPGKPTPKLFLACRRRASEGTRSIKAAARWHPTTGANDSGTDPGGEAVRAPRISPLGPGTAEGPGSTRPRTARTPVLPGRGSLGKPVRPSVRPSGPAAARKGGRARRAGLPGRLRHVSEVREGT